MAIYRTNGRDTSQNNKRYKDGRFLQDCTMEEMIEHCASFVDQVNAGSGMHMTREEYFGQMKAYFPKLKRWRKH